ncbi:hypothetical protein CN238_22975, partial [Sinorhizobium meliloti]
TGHAPATFRFTRNFPRTALPPAGRRWRQPVEGQSRPSGVEAVGFPRDPLHEQYPPHRRDKRQTHQSPLPACGERVSPRVEPEEKGKSPRGG